MDPKALGLGATQEPEWPQWRSTQVQRSLEGYKPQGHKESDSTEETWDTHTLYNYLRKKPLEAYVIAQEIVLTFPK